MVTNVAQEERQTFPGGADQTISTDGKGILMIKSSKKDFYVPMPTDESTLRNRFEIMGAALGMLKMRFVSNRILATASLDVVRGYLEYLCG